MNQTAKLFNNGGTQAVRLPKAFHFNSDEVLVRREGDRVILTPKLADWDEFFTELSAFDDDFMADRDDSLPQEREPF